MKIVEKAVRIVTGTNKKTGKDWTGVDAKVTFDTGETLMFDRKFLNGDDGNWE